MMDVCGGWFWVALWGVADLARLMRSPPLATETGIERAVSGVPTAVGGCW